MALQAAGGLLCVPWVPLSSALGQQMPSNKASWQRPSAHHTPGARRQLGLLGASEEKQAGPPCSCGASCLLLRCSGHQALGQRGVLGTVSPTPCSLAWFPGPAGDRAQELLQAKRGSHL